MTGFYDKLLLQRAMEQQTGRGARGAVQRGGPISHGQPGGYNNAPSGYGGYGRGRQGERRAIQTGTNTTTVHPEQERQGSSMGMGNPMDMYDMGKKGHQGFKDVYAGLKQPGGMFGSGGLFGPDPVGAGLMQGPARSGIPGAPALTPRNLGQNVGGGARQMFGPSVSSGTTPWSGGVNPISGLSTSGAPDVVNLAQQANMSPTAVQTMNQAAGFAPDAVAGASNTAILGTPTVASQTAAKTADMASKGGSNLLGKAGLGLGAGLSIYDMTQNGINVSNALGLAGAGAMGMGMMAGAANFWNPLGWALMAGSIGSSFF